MAFKEKNIKNDNPWFSWVVAGGFMALGIVYILFSDRLVHQFFTDPGTITDIQSLKGILYVLVTSLILGYILSRNEKKKKQTILQLQENEKELEYEITRRKKTMHALEERNEFIEKVVENLPVGLALSNYKTGEFIFQNKRHYEIYGYGRGELENIKDILLKAYDEPEKYEKRYKMLLENPESGDAARYWQENVAITSKGGEKKYINVQFIPIKSQNIIITTIQDVTEKQHARETLLKAKELAERSDRLKSEFLAQVSHEIRTPINVILSFSSLLEASIKDDLEDDLAESFDIMTRSGKRIIRTIDQILNMAQVQTGTYDFREREVNLHGDILREVCNIHKKEAERKGLALNLFNHAKSAVVRGDSYTLYQVFDNLVDNAIKYTEEGHVNITLKTEGEKLAVEVCDTGIGIREDYLPLIFSPFSQEQQGYTRSYEGNGLGLALVKGYCDLNNADLKVKTRKGEGTTFAVYLDKKNAE